MPTTCYFFSYVHIYAHRKNDLTEKTSIPQKNLNPLAKISTPLQVMSTINFFGG